MEAKQISDEEIKAALNRLIKEDEKIRSMWETLKTLWREHETRD